VILRWTAAVAAFVATATVAAAPPPAADAGPLFAPAYPIEVAVLEHAARFHWLDSLAGVELPGGSAGKTVDAHREAFVRLLGRPTDEDRAVLREFAEVRLRYARSRYRTWVENGDADFSGLLTAFLEAPDEPSALERAAALLPPDDLDRLRRALDHFRDRYRAFWKDGTWLDAFVEDARGGRDAPRLARMLRRMAGLFSVALPLDPAPRLVLVPTPSGYGTHATAQGRNLLIELRPLDRLRDAASVIAHENAHLLFQRMPREARDEVEAVFLARGEAGREAWRTLAEALPTALGQGVFDREFRRQDWSEEQPWYHVPEVDAYAKAIHPIVARAFERGTRFDAALALRLWEAWPGRPAAAPDAAAPVTPRSP